MAFVSGFKYDVFISYAWVNNPSEDAEDPNCQWVSKFKKRLATRLDERLGRKDSAEFFFDTSEIKKHQDFQPQIAAAVRDSATMVVLLSDGYLKSKACCEEIRLFQQVTGGDPASTGRLFLMPIDEVPHEKWPADFHDILRNSVGYPFWARNDSTGDAERLAGDDYWKKLNELRKEMVEQLERMQKPTPGDSGGAAMATPAREAGDSTKIPTVCLAKVTADLRRVREDIAAYLTNAGLRVLPAKPYPSDPAKLAESLAADLRQADVFVQVLGPNYSDRTEELPQGEEGLQYERAKQCGTVVLQWRDKSVVVGDIDDEVHRRLVGGSDVISNDLAEFKMLIVQRAQRVHEVGLPPAPDGPQRFALIKADRADVEVAREVVDALKAAHVNCSVTHNGKSMLDRLREVPYDALLVVSVGCQETWLEDRGKELLVVDLNLKSLAPVRAYYVDDPHRLLPYEGTDVLTVVRRDAAGLQRLIGDIQRRGGRA